MLEKNFFRLTMAAMMLLVISLACDLTTTSVDCSVPDLINAINNANSNPAHSTLDLASGCTYTLTAVDNTATSSFGGSTFDYGDNGLPQISTEITINGNNATIIRAGSAPKFRIFFITDTGSLTINDLTLENGFADRPGSAFPSSGGAIYNDGSYLEANNCIMQNNEASFHGGAIFNISNADTFVNGSTIRDNTAPHGGGIFVYHGGLLSVDDCEISDNSASTSGGGISLEYGAELIVNNSTIASNQAGRHGGGIFKDSGSESLPTTITGTTFQDNTADWSGGGVFIFRTPLTISDSDFINNQAEEYGGGLGYQDNSTETVLISNTTFDGNSAGWDGGAIHFSGELMNVSGCTIENNLAENGAGVHNGIATDSRYLIRTDTALTVTSSTIQENTAGGYGGGAFNEGVMTCGESNFVGNQSATTGGGIHNISELEVNGCTFDKNETGLDGGGIDNTEVAVVRGSTFTNNTSTRGGGFSNISGEAEISDSTFGDNTASDRGGAIFNFGTVPGSSPLEILNCEIKDNTAEYGGGIASSVGDTQISESSIIGNKATRDGGGVHNDGVLKVAASTFAGNEASTLGGGIHNVEEVEVRDCTFKSNLAGADGGGLNTYSTAAVSGSTFNSNTGFRGGGLASIGGDTMLINSTFSANEAVDSGGGIFNMGAMIGDTSTGGTLDANHITVAYNSAPVGGGIATSGGKMQIKNSIVADNPAGADCAVSNVDFSSIAENIHSDGTCTGFTLKDDPLLDILANYGGSTDTHALKTGSPAIDAAPDCTSIGGAAVSIDQRGHARPGGPVCDLGAYEDDSGSPLPQQKPCAFTASVNLFCRLGPDDTLYEVVDSLTAGQSALVTGKSWDGVFAYVVGPTNNIICAVPMTASFGKLSGDCEDIPVVVAPDVDESYDEVEEQTGCTVRNLNGGIVCVVPCPPRADPGDPCTPKE
jgi:predicted outer membrane repeat protein